MKIGILDMLVRTLYGVPQKIETHFFNYTNKKMTEGEKRSYRLMQVDPEWTYRVFAFVDKNPVFKPYLYLAPLTRKPIEHVNGPKTIFDEILYQLASAGVKATYAFDMFLKLRTHFQTKFPSLEFDFKVSPGKLKYYTSFINKMTSCGLTPDELTFELFISLNFKEVKGIGQTSMSNICSKYSDDESLFPSTDRAVTTVIKKLYGITKKKQLDELVKTWDDYPVAEGMIFNIFHYS